MASQNNFKHYLARPMVWFYYSEIKKTGSTEGDVDNFYNTMLRTYFPQEEMFGIEQESRPLKELRLTQHTDFRIRQVKKHSAEKVVLIEIERRGEEPTDRDWREAFDLMVKYIELVRAERTQKPEETIYLTVNIGTHLRFYQLDPSQLDIVDFATASASGKTFELAADEEDVHTLFLELQRLTLL